MGFFTNRAVLQNNLDHETRSREYWQNRAERLESELKGESERNRDRERYLLDLLLVKAVKASPVPSPEEPDIPRSSIVPTEDEQFLEDFRNGDFKEWARAAGKSDYEAMVAWEQNKHFYGG